MPYSIIWKMQYVKNCHAILEKQGVVLTKKFLEISYNEHVEDT